MAKFKPVWFDIETLSTNTKTEHPTERDVFEYAVIFEYYTGKKFHVELVSTLHDMIEHLLSLQAKHFELIAHNGAGFDFHFLRRSLIENYNLKPQNDYVRNSVDHTLEQAATTEQGNYLLENRVKAMTKLGLRFKIGKAEFVTTDTLPKFQASIRTLGKQLYFHKIIGKQGEKLHYDYTRFDIPDPVSMPVARKHALKVFNSLSQHDRQYIRNDVDILRLACENYQTLFPKFDYSKRTLSLNILKEYMINPLASLQLMNTVDDVNISYHDYHFDGVSGFDYFHSFYKGGLNFYNDDYVNHVEHDAVHMDLNSSYPNVMAHNQFPTYLMAAGDKPVVLPLDPEYFYMVKMSKLEFNRLIRPIKSKMVRKMFIKYFNTTDEYVYLMTPHISLIANMLGTQIHEIKALSWCKWDTDPFGAKKVLDDNYSTKVAAKKRHADPGEIYVTKVILNGIYGIPALRAFYNLFQIGSEGDYINQINGFKNKERNIVFAGAVTSYALYNLLDPLTKNVAGVDKGFIYCDTDSLFLTKYYFKTIEQGLVFDDYALGAWGLEHPDVTRIYVMNHKKYAYEYRDESGKLGLEIHAGGVPQETFSKVTGFDDLLANYFHDGAILKVMKHTLTQGSKVMALYDADTELNVGGRYPLTYSMKQQLGAGVSRETARRQELSSLDSGEDDTIYYETAYGTFSVGDLFQEPSKLGDNDINALIRVYNALRTEMKEAI